MLFTTNMEDSRFNIVTLKEKKGNSLINNLNDVNCISVAIRNNSVSTVHIQYNLDFCKKNVPVGEKHLNGAHTSSRR